MYTRLTARFLTIFLVLLPLALWGQLGESWRSTVKVPVFAVLQLARCAFPGRAWRLRAAWWYSQSEAPATKRPATAAAARASRLQRRRFHLL